MNNVSTLKQSFQTQLAETLAELKDMAEKTSVLNVKKEQLRGAIYALESLASQEASGAEKASESSEKKNEESANG